MANTISATTIFLFVIIWAADLAAIVPAAIVDHLNPPMGSLKFTEYARVIVVPESIVISFTERTCERGWIGWLIHLHNGQ